ncbi:hypothetical protein GUITHDRAFT_67756, partial [Guillardia theta CCMP2712]
QEIVQAVPAHAYILIADENVFALYGEKFIQKFSKTGKTLHVKVLPSGETTKDRKVKEEVEDYMLEMKMNRDSCCIAMGGGVIGDLTGYIAATYMRGVPFVQIPTTLLAMVDASVGGKTAVNTPMGKNLIGAFHQPVVVYMDMAFLDGFSKRDPKRAEREFRAGIAEIIKTGAIWDASLFEVCEQKVELIQSRDHAVLNEIVRRSVAIKAEVVTLDPKEGGLRAILNWGHTVGHAVEGLCGMADYSDGLLHGECVAIGMVLESNLARAMGLLHSSAVGRIIRCIQAYNLPIKIPEALHIDDIMKKMMGDKKNTGGKLKCVLLDRIGHCYEPKASMVDVELVRMVCSPNISPVPSGPLSGTVRVPGSKSVSNRVLPLAVMGRGDCRIKGLLHSDDTQRCMEALCLLHPQGEAAFEWEEGGEVLRVSGTNGNLRVPKQELYLGNSGTSARFLSGVATVIKEEGGSVVITGNKRMKQRPIKDMVDALVKFGCTIEYLEGEGCPPIKIVSKGLNGGTITMSAQISSQYVSGILLAAPLAQGDLTLQLEEDKPISEPYVDMTVGMMREFGVQVQKPSSNSYLIPSSGYTNPPVYEVEADASAATYPLAIAAITGGRVTCEAVGAGSVQGDANFCHLLAKMGCKVEQTPSSTTVEGPPAGQLMGLGEIDMESMTDAFMTAAVLAAVAKGKTMIRGVANQRVKECNRILVMVEELGKCGVVCRELSDGIEIEGAGGVEGLRGATILCHDDHRIAMSFGVLGCLLPGLIITEKECVEKTYPEFWDHLRLKLRAQLMSADSHIHLEGSKATDPHCILIGMRGAGKTTMGKELARRTKREFVDMDDVAVAEIGMQIIDFVHANGWPKFRELEAALLKRVLQEKKRGCIIACGGGIVETEECREGLKAAAQAGHMVVHMMRDIREIEELLTSDPSRPKLPEPPAVAWTRREPLYKQCSTHEFLILSAAEEGEAAHEELFSLVDRFLRSQLAPVVEDSITISLTYPDMKEASSYIPEIERGADVLEFRVDLLSDCSLLNARLQHAILRRVATLPILWTVRSVSQGGKFAGSEEEMLALLQLGLRLGCEFVDVESCWSTAMCKAVVDKKGSSRVVASFHDFSERAYTAEELEKLFLRLRMQGGADVVKVAIRTTKATQVADMQHAINRFRARSSLPAVGLCMGEEGKLSRVLNKFLTFSTHPLLPGTAAPGQLVAEDIRRLKVELGLLPATCSFFLFGSPIAKSASPAMHNAAFAACGLKGWSYERCETADVSVALETISSASFGGGSVTIPLKEELLPHMHILTDSARRIGAVNTITVKRGGDGSRILIGDNTDWVAIHRLVQDRLNMRRLAQGGEPRVLLVGAGGTARAAMYALKKLRGITGPVLVYNRTKSRAEALAAEFGAEVVEDLSSVTQLGVIVSTIPPDGHAVIPETLLQARPIMLDASYLPGGTSLSQRAAAAGCDLIIGPHMLFEQATYQSERWTGRKARRSVMAKAICSHFGAESGLQALLAHEMKGQ